MSLLPPSTLLMGPAGTGKTSAIVTLLQAGLRVGLLATEPSAPNRVIEEAKRRGVTFPVDHFEWAFVSPSPPSWGALIESAKIVNTMSLKDISDMRSGIAKSDGKQWLALLNSIANFTSERTGLSLGDVTEWGPTSAFVIDGLSGVSTMSRNLTVGLKPNPSPGEWGVMQSNIQTLIGKLCSDCKCFFVLIAHVERENNELTGMSNIMVSTLGAKLAPKLPGLFTNVIYAKRQHANFLWSTADSGVDTKNGDLPLSDTLQPTFAPIIESYRRRTNTAAPAAASAPPALAT